MPSLTEISLFKACVETPKVAHLANLNLSNIKMTVTDGERTFLTKEK